MPTLSLFDLRCGDILLTKHEGGLTHKVISIGSFLTGNFGTASYVHAQIVCRDGGGGTNLLKREGPTQIAESFSGGLQIEVPHSPATVFRMNPYGGGVTSEFASECARRAAKVAIELTGRQQPNDAFARYNFVGAAASLFTPTGVSGNVVNQLKQIEAGTSHDRLFCSQYVVVCYQVAILRMVKAGYPPQTLLPFELDAKSMEPAYLASYMRRNPQHWKEVGEFPG